MRIEILHARDPDYECAVRVWIDGVLATNVVMEDIDPGRGYDRSEWDARIADAKADTTITPAYKDAVLEALDAGGQSKYVTDH